MQEESSNHFILTQSVMFITFPPIFPTQSVRTRYLFLLFIRYTYIHSVTDAINLSRGRRDRPNTYQPQGPFLFLIHSVTYLSSRRHGSLFKLRASPFPSDGAAATAPVGGLDPPLPLLLLLLLPSSAITTDEDDEEKA